MSPIKSNIYYEAHSQEDERHLALSHQTPVPLLRKLATSEDPITHFSAINTLREIEEK